MTDLSATRFFHRPKLEVLKSVYRELSRGESIELDIVIEDLNKTLLCLESSGYYGMTIDLASISLKQCRIKAWKGKAGPCFDTGKTTQLHSPALAVMDDDAHFIYEKIRVCEKTARIYSGEMYDSFLSTDEGDPELISKLDENPVLFDCNTFSQDVARVMQHCPDRPLEGKGEVIAMYPGPFKAIVLKNGAWVQRGQAYQLNEDDRAYLLKEGLLQELPPSWSLPVKSLVSFKALVEMEGESRLLSQTLSEENVSEKMLDWQLLEQLSKGLRECIIQAIQKEHFHFVLTGSDPLDIGGCCPSDLVGESNRLVDAGILIKRSSEQSDDACPITLYAFRGEHIAETNAKSKMNPSFRNELRERIETKAQQSSGHLFRFLFLGFILLSFIIATIKMIEEWKPVEVTSPLSIILDLKKDDELIVLFFRSNRECGMCDRMKELSKHSPEQLRESLSCQLRIREVNYESKENEELREYFDIFTSSIVLIRVKDGEVLESRLLKEAWELTRDPAAFEDLYHRELKRMCEVSE